MNAITAIAPASSAPLPAIITGSFAALPKSIQHGIVALSVAFPAGIGAMSESDNRMRFDIYAEAVDGYPVVVVNWAVRKLRLSNPRNPFAPTPQDLHELCKKRLAAWADHVCRYVEGGRWSPPVGEQACPPPWSDGCYLASDTIRLLLRYRYWKRQLESASDTVFERIPHDMFEAGERERIFENRRIHKEWKAQQAAVEEAERAARAERK